MRCSLLQITMGLALAAALFGFALSRPAAAMEESTLPVGRFGRVHLYQSGPQPRHVVLFVSGDGGWNRGVVDMARILAGLDALVVGIDIVHYLKQLGRSGEACLYPAADFESLSKFVQKRLDFKQYIQPVLVGYSSGAALVYALICQAPANTFKAALSLGFCPDLPLPRAPCRGSGLTWQGKPGKEGYVFKPDKELQAPWVVFQGDIDQVCDARRAKAFAAEVPGAEVIALPKVGHGFSVPRNWLPQFKKVFSRLVAPGKDAHGQMDGLDDLPLVEVPAHSPGGHSLAVMISGDGGWAGIDREMADALAGRSVPVVGLNSLKYFWTARTPDSAGRDLARILRYYLQAWQKEKAILIGYSLGADVLPFMVSRLPDALRSRIGLIVLLGPSRQTAFEFRLSEWFGMGNRAKQYPLMPEIERMDAFHTLCIYGEKERGSLCREALPSWVDKVALAGGHHFGGDYEAIVRLILGKMDSR